jgi:ribosome-associated toxin RatA of RatAB toxin-antitoxin module
MIARFLYCVLLFWAAAPSAQLPTPAPTPAPGPEVSVRRTDVDGEAVFEVGASGIVAAAAPAVWKVLTDYERMPEFVPDMQSARVLERSGNRVVVEQLGTARFLFIRRDIHLVVQVQEQPMTLIDVGLITGDMKLYNCRWELQALAGGGTRIVYSGRLAPKFYVPAVLGASLIRADITRMMTAVLERLERPD